MTQISMIDFTSHHDGGSMIGLVANTADAQQWLDDNVETEPYQHLGSILWMEARCGLDVLNGLLAEGYSLEDGATGRIAQQ